MNLTLTADEQTFQTEARHFIDANWPAEMRKEARKVNDSSARFQARNTHEERWFRALVKAGWSVPNWPVEHGGTGWTLTQKYIWEQETALADCPQMSAFGTRMLAPVLYTWGTKAQQDRFLPAIREANIQWCQGYSEPGAGSDLAALSTKAEKSGHVYIVTGAKTWITGAHTADWMFCLVRTDTKTSKRQLGISFLLIDMRSKGITVKPIMTLGNHHSVNTVTLENVQVPTDQLVGEEGKGWTYAKGLLAHERTGIAGVARAKAELARLRCSTADISAGEGTLADDISFQQKLNSLEIELMALEITELRVLSQVEQGSAPGHESSILKIKGTEISQQLSELMIEAHGYYSIPYPAQYLDNEGPIGPENAIVDVSEFLMRRASSIFGGSNEIQRNIIAKSMLGF